MDNYNNIQEGYSDITAPPLPPPPPTPNGDNRKIKNGIATGLIVFIVLVALHFILVIFGIVDVTKHCPTREHTLRILLLLFVPFYPLIYLFIRKTTCLRK